MELPNPDNAQRTGKISRVVRFSWRFFCATSGALILGALAGFSMSNLWIGLAAAVPGAIAGWYFGRYVSPLEVIFPGLNTHP